jgi:hypothetical protein
VCVLCVFVNAFVLNGEHMQPLASKPSEASNVIYSHLNDASLDVSDTYKRCSNLNQTLDVVAVSCKLKRLVLPHKTHEASSMQSLVSSNG